MRIYHVESRNPWEEGFQDRKTGAKFALPTELLCPDCTTPALEGNLDPSGDSLNLKRIIHDKTCLALKRRVSR